MYRFLEKIKENAMATMQWRFSRRCIVVIALGSSHTILQSEHSDASPAVREYLKHRNPTIEKVPFWAAPTLEFSLPTRTLY